MRILLWHGYLLRGTGSNIYTSHLARSWRRSGHDVLLLCQETEPLDFVDEIGAFAPDNSSFAMRATGTPPGSGSCRVVRPDIAGLLPVYVYDEYPDFTVKLFIDLSDEELDRYTSANVTAMVTAIREHEPDMIITGHEVMGPYIALVACRETGHAYTAKLHGSALEFAVKLQERYLHYAIEGLGGARHVVGGSEYMLEEAAKHIPGWRDRAEVVNPGCDTELFRPRSEPGEGAVVGYVGKLIAAKGVHNLLAALPLADTDGLRSVIVGFGGFEIGIRALAEALAQGDVERALQIASQGERSRSEGFSPAGPLELLRTFLETHRDDADYWQRAASIDVQFAGRLEHEPLSGVLPTFDLLVVSSVISEAFGMVAAEAAACGVLPLVPDHSGIGEVGRALEDAVGFPGLLRFDPADPIVSIAQGIDRVLGLPGAQRREMASAAVRLAHSRWSWDHVAAKLLEVAAR